MRISAAVVQCVGIVILLQVLGRVESQVFRKVQRVQRRNATSVAKDTTVTLREGHPIRLLSAPTRGGEERYATTSTTGEKDHSQVIPSEWSDSDSQQWVPLQVGGSKRYLLIQKSEWNYTKLEELDTVTKALSLDSVTGNVTVEPYTSGSTSQQWTLLKHEAGTDAVIFLLRNYGNEQCLKNYDHKDLGLIKRIASFIKRLREPYKPKPPPHPLSTLDCIGSDASQRWVAVEV